MKRPSRAGKSHAGKSENPEWGDYITYGASLSFAAVSAIFAGYMWQDSASRDTRPSPALQHVLRGADYQDARPLQISLGEAPQRIAADPITTAGVGSDRETDGQPANRQEQKGLLENYALLGLYGSFAVVQHRGADKSAVLTLRVGSHLPGAGEVLAIEILGKESYVLTSAGIIGFRG